MVENNNVDYYAILGVSKDAEDIEIKRIYRKLAKTCHPDHNPDDKVAEKRFKEITAAYKVLQDPVLRKEYDRYCESIFGGSEVSPSGDVDADYFSSVFGDEENLRDSEILRNFYEYLKKKERKKKEEKKKEDNLVFSAKRKEREEKKEDKKKKDIPFYNHPGRRGVLHSLNSRIFLPKLLATFLMFIAVMFLLFTWIQKKDDLINKLKNINNTPIKKNLKTWK